MMQQYKYGVWFYGITFTTRSEQSVDYSTVVCNNNMLCGTKNKKQTYIIYFCRWVE